MCGIIGIFDKTHHPTNESLRLMTNSLSHRGPDAEGFYNAEVNCGTVGLGHRRLSIIDLSTSANQPMRYDNIMIVYNGEVYNYLDIQKELESVGYTFNTNSDTEVVLKAFHKWGIESLHKFRGMFSFCIYNLESNKAYLVRDRVGVKPFYYYHDNNTFLFSSEAKSFRYHKSFKGELCEQGLNLYFQYGYIPSPYTIFAGAKKIRPGCYIEYDFRNNIFREEKYWDLADYYQQPKLQITHDEAAIQLDALLRKSFSLRMVADVPVGVLLSGGVDSSVVAAVLQDNANQQINTFTMGFERIDYDESSHARNVAKYLGTNHHERICTWNDAENIIAELPKMYDEPFADSSAIPTALISQFSKKSVSVILSGDGGDELFSGYSSYAINEKRFNKINSSSLLNNLSPVFNKIPDPIMGFYRLHPNLYNRYLKLKSTLQSHTIEDQYRSIIRIFSSMEMSRLLPTYNFYKQQHNTYAELTMRERMMLVDFQHYLPDDILVKVDRATMYYSLEGREPLLDHTILEFAAQLPISLKADKLILKNVLRKYLPPSYFERKKQGFGVPVNHWLRKDLRYLLDKYLNKNTLIKQGVFCHHYVTKLKNTFLKTNIDDNKIWTLLMFQMWYENFFNETF